ncbi:hypothetical protein F5Y10DRAFT_266789 [Nemania abortiva]|nr:hypothetical protein F5Y10DRAFT_266789 [Nemania abortiva]
MAGTFTLVYESQAVYQKILTATSPSDALRFTILDSTIGEATLIISNFTTWATKLPILLLYIRIFGVSPWVRRVSYITIILSLLVTVAATAYAAPYCNPHGRYDPVASAKCVSTGPIGSLITGFEGLVVDIIIFVLPIPVISKLKLPLRRKLGVALVFATGILGIGASIAGNWSRVETLSGSAAARQLSTIFVIYEGTVALFVGCVPAIYYLWRAVILESAIYSRIQGSLSKISQLMVPSSRQSQSSKQSTSEKMPSEEHAYRENS